MKVLVLIAHADPTKKATAYRIADTAEQALIGAGHEVKKVNLVEEGFSTTATTNDFNQLLPGPFSYGSQGATRDNLKPEITKYQDMVTWCDHILVVGPMWKFRYPACLYAFVERVFTFGFGYTDKLYLEKGLLKGRKVSCIITTEADNDFYSTRGLGPIDFLLFATTYSFRYDGLESTCSLLYPSANEKETIAHESEWMEKFKKAIIHLDSWKPLPVNTDPKVCEAINIAHSENCNVENIYTIK